MKKYFTSDDYRFFNTKKSNNAIIRHRKKKARKRGPSGKRPVIPAPTKGKQVVLSAPVNFSLINNTENTISYFNIAHKYLKDKKAVLFDIANVSTLTTDAIAVLVAKIKDKKFHCNTWISGNAPTDQNLKKLFFESGFYDYVNTTGLKPSSSNKLLIHKITKNRVEPDHAKNACLLGLRHTFHNDNIFEPLYNILIEIMQNTNNHAGLTVGKFNWWLHVYNHPDSRITSYTFLDLGVGIFESLPVKSFKRQFYKAFGLESNLDLVPKLFNGEIKSRTARPERGKGIPQVFECSQDKVFSKFILISNDIYADLKRQNYQIMKLKFRGTLFYWEINNR